MPATHEPLSRPAVLTRPRILRVLGTASTVLEPILRQAKADLGFTVEGKVLDGNIAHQVGVVAPESFDVYDQWFHNLEFVWTAHSIRPIELSRIKRWSEIGELALTGKADAALPPVPGGGPNRLLYVQGDGRLSETPAERISMLPLSHCADSFGYRRELLPESADMGAESWSWLLDPAWKRATLQSNASIGAIDAILAVQAAGLVQFRDPGNLSIAEIDSLMRILISLRRRGHFPHFWETQAQSAELFARGRARIGSIWSSALVLPALRGVDIRTAVPREGYRGWFGGMSISRHAAGPALDMAYEYLNWWLDGWPGAVVARHGYYFSAPELVRRHLTAAEWDYWYGGLPAVDDLAGPLGDLVVTRGHIREGGAYQERVSRIAIWNAVMDEHNYLVRRWHDFLNFRH
ncbi:extracellular solute-binding protein [Mesorhizobium sp. M0518]|uniref:ABC transporter substrate-binding protein n=1 Tax=unclassified Mesorhizobium TaxID=325217 RepID=UPI00333705D0